MKKIIFIAGLWLTLLGNAQEIPFQKYEPENRLEKTLEQKELENQTGKILEEKIKHLNKDEIYRLTNSCYNNLKEKGLKIPNYITPQLMRVIARIESGDNPRDISSAGARGLWQIMPCTWAEVENISKYKIEVFIPEKNCEVAIKYWVWLDKACRILHSNKQGIKNWDNLPVKKKIERMAQAYNWGIGNTSKTKWDFSKMPKETQKYTEKLMSFYEKIFPVAYKNNFATDYENCLQNIRKELGQ